VDRLATSAACCRPCHRRSTSSCRQCRAQQHRVADPQRRPPQHRHPHRHPHRLQPRHQPSHHPLPPHPLHRRQPSRELMEAQPVEARLRRRPPRPARRRPSRT
jgi:hypothetical protein